jgi:hypothetical protein
MNSAAFVLIFTLPLNPIDNSLSSKQLPQNPPPAISQQLKIMPQIGVIQGSGIKFK